jgi:small subunit ribosomal protein S4
LKDTLDMSKRKTSKYKLDRRMGENIWGRPKSSVNRRAYGPGQHGQRRKSKVSDFGIQLRAKQKLKGYYGDVTEKQFKRTYQEAAKIKGDTGQNLIGLLEQRLDMIRSPDRQPRPHPRQRREVQHRLAPRAPR